MSWSTNSLGLLTVDIYEFYPVGTYVFFCIVGLAIALHCIFKYDRKKKYSLISSFTCIGASAMAFDSILTIAYITTANEDKLSRAVFNLTSSTLFYVVSFADNYVILYRYHLTKSLPKWSKVLFHTYIWVANTYYPLTCGIVPIWVNTMDPTFLNWLIPTFFVSSFLNLIFDIYFIVAFVRMIKSEFPHWRDNSVSSSASFTIFIKSIFHCIVASNQGRFWLPFFYLTSPEFWFMALPRSYYSTYEFVVVLILHCLFNINIERIICKFLFRQKYRENTFISSMTMTSHPIDEEQNYELQDIEMNTEADGSVSLESHDMYLKVSAQISIESHNYYCIN